MGGVNAWLQYIQRILRFISLGLQETPRCLALSPITSLTCHPQPHVIRLNGALPSTSERPRGLSSLRISNTGSMAPSFNSTALSILFPLSRPSSRIWDHVCKTVFDWEDCIACSSQGKCLAENCSWIKRPAIASYLQFYAAITSRSMDDDVLHSHQDLLEIVDFIRHHPDKPRRNLVQEYQATHCRIAPDSDFSRAFDLAMSALVMVPCSQPNFFDSRMGVNPGHSVWLDNLSGRTFFVSKIKQCGQSGPARATRLAGLSAARLDACGIKLSPTNDFQKHLLYDSESKCVYLFHHIGFLKECLARNRANASAAPCVRCLSFKRPVHE